MFTYILGTIFSIFLYFFFLLFPFIKNKKFLHVFLSLIPLCIISAIRYDVGWDYLGTYTVGFKVIGYGYNIHYFTEEPFNILVRIIYYFSNAKNEWLFIICSLITFIFLSLGLKNNSKNIPVSILLILLSRYYFLSMNIVRQGISMAIFFYSIKYIKEKNLKKYILFILLASCFHMMSIIYLPFYFICQYDFSKKNNIIKMMTLLFLGIISYAFILKFTKYGMYVGSKFDSNNFMIHEFLLSFSLLFCSLFVKKKSKDYEYRIFYNLTLVYFVLSSLSFILPTSDRICWLFYIHVIAFIPLLINKTRGVEKVFISVILFSILSTSFYMQTVVGDSYSVLPYMTIFGG